MNNSTFFQISAPDPPEYVYFYVAIFSVASVCGTIGNICVIAAMLLTKSLRTVRNVFIVNLSCSDLVVCTVSMPATVIGIMKGKEWNEEHWVWCRFTSLVCGTACMASMYSCVMIAVSRYYYIAKYPKYLVYFTKKKVIVYISLLWTFSVVVCLPNHFGWGEIKFSNVLYFCYLDTSTYSYLTFYTILKIVAICLSLLFYVKMYRVLRTSTLSKRMIIGKKEKDESKPMLSTDQKIAEELKIIKVTFKVFALFAVCWSPMIVLYLFTFAYKGPHWLNLSATFLGHSNSSINFIVYFLDNNVFRNAVIDCLAKKKSRSATPVTSAME